jgi:hypothetical protein
VKAIIYEKKLEELKPSHILSKIMAHELQIMPNSKKAPQEKPQEPSSPTTSHALSSQQEKVMSRMATHGSSSEDDCNDGDDEDSSSDEEVESMVSEYVKKIFKYVKKVNMYDYNIQLREGRHHQHIKFTKIEHKPKKKVVKEWRPRQDETITVCEWTSGGESSLSSSSDESKKNFTTRFMHGPSSSLHMCLMAKGMESNVSDESPTPPLSMILLSLSMRKKECLRSKLMKLNNSMLSMILVQPLLQIMNICCANSNCLARSVMSKNLSLRVMRLKQVIPLSLMTHLSLVQFLSPR